jgi:hypothetical protein
VKPRLVSAAKSLGLFPLAPLPTCTATSAKLAFALAAADEFRDAIAADALLLGFRLRPGASAETGEAAGGLATASCNDATLLQLCDRTRPNMSRQLP